MPANNKEMEIYVLETANRLHLIQVDFADESEQTRMDYLCEEIERALKKVLPEEKNEFLQSLQEKFPIGNIATLPMLKEREDKDISVTDQTRRQDADFLVHSLLEIFPILPADQKESITKKLQEMGSESPVRVNYSDESIEKLRTKLQLGDEPDFDTDRLAELIVLLANFVYKLEPLVWNTWRQLSPRSSIRRSGDLKKAMGQFLSNDSNISQENVENELKELQQLTAAVITAIGRVGSQFAKHHLARFSPSEISSLVKMEHRSVLVSHEVKCWRKFLELADTLNEDSIDTEITKAIVNYVESLMKGLGR
ncbi:MAG: hypothetical protein H8D56_20955 [Planctomycetes bacterium]|nr:hypothetical protein [Planctomycetota bacterium]MBL7142743.1 hypothetical protein [Phycisphaerae bacterium]